jgi:hypothetical protein
LATREVSRSRAAAFFAGLAFIFAPCASYLLPGLMGDASAFAGAALPPPWRLVALVEYGEGPHVLSLSLALFALAATARYVRVPSALGFAVAVATLLAVALTNLIGVLGAALFVILLPASERIGGRAEGRWWRVLSVGVIGALLSLGWYSLGFIRAVFGFSAPGGAEASAYALLPVMLVVVLIAIAWLDRRLPHGAALVIGWLLVFGAIVVARQLFAITIAPQPIRYALELDAAAAMGIGIACAALLGRFRVRARERVALGAGLAAAAVIVALGAGGWLAVRDRLAPDPAWRDWSERRVAIWLDDHLAPGERAYLTGDHAFWLNAFADVPQVRGGVDFAFANPWWAHVTYQVNTGAEAAIAARWMRALPARYIVVPGPASSEIYRDYADPQKFEGRLPLVFDQRGVRIYEVSRVGDPLMVVAKLADLPVPTSAIDVAALDAYLDRIGSGHPAASLQERGLGAFRADVVVAEGEAVVLRQAYDTGWHALVDGREAAVRADPIGQLLIDVPPGRHVLELDHRVHNDLLAGVAVALFTALALIGGWIRSRLRGVRGT